MVESQADMAVEWSWLPTLLLSSSGVVQAENQAVRRLMLFHSSQETLIGRNFKDLDIALFPTKNSVRRDLSAMLSAAAVHLKAPPNDTNNTFLTVENDVDLRTATTRFWDNEDAIAPVEKSDVIVSRRIPFSERPKTGQRGQRMSTVRSLMCIFAIYTRHELIYRVTFDRPNLPQSSSNGSATAGSDGEQQAPREWSSSDLSQALLNFEEMSDQSVYSTQIIGRLIPHCTAILNPDGQVLHLSPSWYEFTGLDKAESNGTEWVQAVHPDDSASMLEAWQEVLQYKYDHWTFEARYRMHNGEYRWFLVRAQPYKDEAGVILRWFASMLDVNESMLQRLQTERIRQSILKLMSKADVSLWGVNQNHEIHIREGALSWIPSSQQQVGPGAPRDVSGHTAEREEQEIANMIQSILDGQQSQATLEHQMEGRWYRTKFVADLDNTINDKDGKAVVQAALGLTIDITDVRARAMLQIENQGLIANERAAQDATKLKSRFLANMSHEIRTPISGIIGLSELLSESVLNREQEELVGGIQQSAAFLLSLINDILDFSKIESGHMDIEAVAFQPCKVINDLLRMIGIQAKEKGLQLIYRNDLSEEPSVVGDPGRLRQVLTNLLSNSIKFTQEGSVSLSLRAITPRIDFAEDGKDSELDKRPQRPAADDDAGENLTLEFVVEDTGCGISEEVMQKLFRPFSQADSSTARTHGGTGLGLTISRQLVEMMGGRIDLTSRPSFGTVATFQIPYLRSTPGHPTTPRSTSTTQPSTRDSSVSTATTGLDHTIAPSSLAHRPEKIDVQTLTLEERNRTHVLVVEDNAVNQRIAKANLRKLGFSVAAVWNGEEALAYLDRSPSPDNSVPDIIFMDCMMPVLDGYKATQILRHDKARFSKAIRAIPVIAMTASAIQGDREKCKAAGMDDYLTKPTSKDTMERAIQLWVFRHRNSPDGQ